MAAEVPFSEFVGLPTGADVIRHAGLDTEDAELVALADRQVQSTLTLAWVHTRGVGFHPSEPECTQALWQVAVSAAARATVNPTEARRTEVGGFSVLHGETGWSLRELAVLNSFRRRVG